ncbi:MAG: hypothetical protein OIF38_15720 [Cellvibrionaceae bacterium]|nr:hypothetical protein [Cellvibrionaceae bacterium]
MKILTSLIIIFICHASIAVGQQADMDNIIRALEQDPPEKFEAVMKAFIERAQAGDAEGMISLSSHVTIAKIGMNKLRAHYQKDTIPVLKACTEISYGGNNIHVGGEQFGTGAGWVFEKSCLVKDGKDLSLRFIVLKENGRIALTSFGLAD